MISTPSVFSTVVGPAEPCTQSRLNLRFLAARRSPIRIQPFTGWAGRKSWYPISSQQNISWVDRATDQNDVEKDDDMIMLQLSSSIYYRYLADTCSAVFHFGQIRTNSDRDTAIFLATVVGRGTRNVTEFTARCLEGFRNTYIHPERLDKANIPKLCNFHLLYNPSLCSMSYVFKFRWLQLQSI